jgi:plasmid stabilization system protein ParE
MRIRWTTNALNDFKAISYHIEKDRGLATANRVCRTIVYRTIEPDAVHILRVWHGAQDRER